MNYGIFKGDGKPKGAMAAFGKKEKAKKDKKIKMEALSNWKEDYPPPFLLHQVPL